MFNFIESALLLFCYSKGIKNKMRFIFYLLLNGLNKLKIFKFGRMNFKLAFKEVTFWIGLSSAELSSYIEIYIRNAYDKAPDFVAKEGDVVVDVGSNVGLYTIKQANRVGVSGKIWSFEPNPLSFERLMMNLEENGIKNAKIFKKAVSSTTGNLKFSVDFGITTEGKLLHLGEPVISGNNSVIEVECITLDNFVIENNIKRIDILKIDTEGEELEVLKGASGNALSIIKKIVMEYHGKEIRQAVSSFLKEKKFNILSEDEKNRVLYFEKES